MYGIEHHYQIFKQERFIFKSKLQFHVTQFNSDHIVEPSFGSISTAFVKWNIVFTLQIVIWPKPDLPDWLLQP